MADPAAQVRDEVRGLLESNWDPDLDLLTALLSAPSSSIAHGTDEVQRNIIGEQILGRPKDRGSTGTRRTGTSGRTSSAG